VTAEKPRESPYELEFYETVDGDQPARRWMRELTPHKRRALGMAMNEVLAHMGVGVCETAWGKPLGQGLYEFRLRDDEESGGRILLRVFFHPFADNHVLLLGGYDKGRHPSKRFQEEQIEQARRRLSAFLAARRRC
jgi:phage-related protein